MFGKEIATTYEQSSNRQVLGVYLSGSRLNGLAFRPTDYDVIMVLAPTQNELLYGHTYASQSKFDVQTIDGAVTVDAKVYNLTKFLSLVHSGEPNVIEIFSQDPMYATPELQQFHESIPQIHYINPQKVTAAAWGMYKQADKMTDHTSEKYIKTLLNAIKVYHYSHQLLSGPVNKLYTNFFDDETLNHLKHEFYHAKDGNRVDQIFLKHTERELYDNLFIDKNITNDYLPLLQSMAVKQFETAAVKLTKETN